MDNLMLLIMVIGISIVLIQAKTIELDKNNFILTERETPVLSKNDTLTAKNVSGKQ